MRRGVIAASAVLSLVFAAPVFAADGAQPPQATAPSFEQIKADHLKRLDERLNSLQQEKVCAQAAKNQDELRACRAKHKSDMKKQRNDMRMRGPGGPGGTMPPLAQ